MFRFGDLIMFIDDKNSKGKTNMRLKRICFPFYYAILVSNSGDWNTDETLSESI